MKVMEWREGNVMGEDGIEGIQQASINSQHLGLKDVKRRRNGYLILPTLVANLLKHLCRVLQNLLLPTLLPHRLCNWLVF